METDIKLEWRVVKEVFKKYHDHLLYLKVSEQPSVTEQHQIVIDFTDKGIDFVGDYVVKRQEALYYNNKVNSSINRLSAIERKIIIPSYITSDYVAPWKIYEDSHIGRTLFYTIKARAIGKLHVLFQVEGLSNIGKNKCGQTTDR